MNEHIDPLEAELAAMRPHEPSPALRQQIAEELKTGDLVSASSRSSRNWWGGAAVGGLVAACLAAGLLLFPVPPIKSENDSSLAPVQLPVAAAFDDALPTVWTYRRALSRSPRDLEVLLDKHAALAPPQGGSAPTHLFIRSDAELLFNGEL